MRISSCSEALKLIGVEIVGNGNGGIVKKNPLIKILPFAIIGSAFIVVIYFLLFYEKTIIPDEENISVPVENDSVTLNNNNIVEEILEAKNSSASNKKEDILTPGEIKSEIEKPEDIVYSPVEKEKENNIDAIEKYGDLYIECYPWGDVYIESLKVDTTPLNKSIKLSTGEYQLSLIHPDYPEFESKINIFDGETTSVRVNLDTLFGYLDCRIYPWGEIFINGEKRGDTPLENPIRLFPGEYQLTVKNPNYQSKTDNIIVNRNDTLKVKYFLDRN